MATLTEMSITFRKLVLWFIALFIAYLLLKVLFDLGVSYWKATHPIPIPPPDVRFNKLPAPKFAGVATSSSGFKFFLENIEGRPPETTASALVFSMPKKLPSLFDAERAKKFAAAIGFTNPPQITSSTQYHFTDPSDPLRTLDLDSITMKFDLRYDYQKNTKLFPSGQIINKEKTAQDIKNYLGSNNLFDDTILRGKSTVDLLHYDTTTKKIIPASSLSTTNALRVNFFRSDIRGLKVLPVGFDHSFNYVFYTPSPAINTSMLEISYTYWPVNLDDFATYPLRNSASAWQDLMDGYAYIIRLGDNKPDRIVIRSIYLAYYDSKEPQSYLQPIFVFEGDNGFVAYLPAISSEWLE